MRSLRRREKRSVVCVWPAMDSVTKGTGSQEVVGGARGYGCEDGRVGVVLRPRSWGSVEVRRGRRVEGLKGRVRREVISRGSERRLCMVLVGAEGEVAQKKKCWVSRRMFYLEVACMRI